MLYVSACLSVCSSQPTLCHSSFDSLRRHSLNIIRYDSQKLVFPSHSFVIPQLFSATRRQIRHLHCCREKFLIELIFFGEQEKTSAQWQTPAWFWKITRNSILKDIFQGWGWHVCHRVIKYLIIKFTGFIFDAVFDSFILIQSQNQKPKKVIPLLTNSRWKYCTLGHKSFNSHRLNYLNTNNPVFF